MSKYEQLKSSISNWYGELKRSIGIDNIKVIKELIYQAIPKEVMNIIKVSYFYRGNCPKCNHSVERTPMHPQYKYFCPNCGQALEWK